MTVYIDLNIEISGSGGSYSVKGTTDKLGTFNDKFEPPFRLQEIDVGLLGSGSKRGSMVPIAAKGAEDKAAPKTSADIGKLLYKSLFSGNLLALLERVTTAATERGVQGVRIRLNFNLDSADLPEVAALPWELMHNPKDSSPMAASTKTVIVRCLDVEEPEKTRPKNQEVRVLLIGSNPIGSEPLALDKESKAIAELLKDMPNVTVETVPPREEAIKTALQDHQYQVVHYMGHGKFDPKVGGMLALQDEDNLERLVDADEFRTWMTDEPLQLVFLNGCSTGATPDAASEHPFSGLAAALVKLGVPAVVAMQFPITDKAALKFAETFYRAISKGDPVDTAVGHARKALWSRTNVEWATPVLYMRTADGNLFSPVEQAPATPPDPTLLVAPQNLVASPPTGNIWQRQNAWGKIGMALIGMFVLLWLLLTFVPEPDEETPPQTIAEAAQTAPLDIDMLRDELTKLPAAYWVNDQDANNKALLWGDLDDRYKLTPETWVELLKPLAKESNGKAAHLLGVLYENGDRIPKDPKRAFELYKFSADAGVPVAMMAVGISYLNGDGVEKDETLGCFWLQKAAQRGNYIARDTIRDYVWTGTQCTAADR